MRYGIRPTFPCVLFAFAVLLAGTLQSGTGGPPLGADTDVCDGVIFPPDCVDQLGAIGTPPVESADEGFLHIVSPVVDPLLLLESSNAADGRLFTLNPLGNSVRVLDPSNGLSTIADIKVCYRPSALAQNADGSEVLVSCHASNAVVLIDPVSNRVVARIEDRDSDGRPRLQEPMGIAVVGDVAYVASSQNHRVAVIDLATRSVTGYVDVPGEDPRSLSVTPDGKFLIVANLLAGNRSETDIELNAHMYQEEASPGDVCVPLLEGDGANVIDETHPQFMDTSHPNYEVLAECYLFGHTNGESTEVIINPVRPDHDLAVIRLSDLQVVFTTDTLPGDVGTLNYGVHYSAANGRVYLATTHARNALDTSFGNRPIVNGLSILTMDAVTGALSIQSIVDLDDPFLDEEGLGSAVAATPYAITVAGDRVLLAAAGSDRLVTTDLNGNVTGSVAVGFTPKGVVADGDTAYVYNATGFTVSRVDLLTGEETATAGIGDNALSQSERIGAHLMNSAEFAINKTFSCASCHPDAHTDALVWMLNEFDGERSTMTVQEIREFAPFHWDGSKCNLAQILVDGITFLFQDPDGPSLCEMKTMIDFMEGTVRPHTPYRRPDDLLSEEAKLGLGILHRGRFKDLGDGTQVCSGRDPDPAMEAKLLAAAGDPFAEAFIFDDAGGPASGTSTAETCSRTGCHVAPHAATQGGKFEAVSVHGIWDRPISKHNGRPTRAGFLEALEINRAYHGAPPMDAAGHVTGKAAAHSFNDAHFRHPELNFDANPATHGFTLTDAMTRFMLEEEHYQTGAVGLTIVLDVTNVAAPSTVERMDLLESAAGQGKIAWLGVGTLAGALQSLVWDPQAGEFSSDAGGTYSVQQLEDALLPGDSVMLYGALQPGQDDLPNPKLRLIRRPTSPIVCYEDYAQYHANVVTGETDAALILRGIDVVAGSRVMVDGQVTGAPLAGIAPEFTWELPQAPSEPTILALQILSPRGLQSNAMPVPVVPPVVPATEPQILTASKTGTQGVTLGWDDQFGLTGPGTRYDVYRGEIGELQTDGFTAGRCFRSVSPTATVADNTLPDAGEGFYYLLRAQNQVNVTSYGSPERDAGVEASPLSCAEKFP